MKTIKLFLLAGLALLSMASAVAGFIFKAWHLFFISFATAVLFSSLVNPKNDIK